MKRIVLAAALFITVSCLNACSLFQSNSAETKKGLCNELKRRMIFTGATNNQTLASQQRGELAKINQTYRNQGCS